MPTRFAEIEPGIWRGGEPTEKDLQIFKNIFHIKRIVSLDQTFHLNPIVEKLGMEHIIFPVYHIREIQQQVNALKNNIDDLFNVRPMYIHCRHGRDRTGLVVALYRISQGWTPQKAYDEAKSFGFGEGLSAPVEKMFKDAIFGNDRNVNTSDGYVSDVVDRERQEYPGMNFKQDEARHYFDIANPPEQKDGLSQYDEHPIDSQYNKDKNINRKRIIQEMLKENEDNSDMNDLMAGVIGSEMNTPIFRGIGPVEPFGAYPFGYSLVY